MLYDQHSPSASGARGFAVGKVFSNEGSLVASVAQEGLIRPLGPLRETLA
jgi:acyl-CoA thioesterase-2